MRRLLLALLPLFALPTAGLAAKRALIIGNDAYPTQPLRSCVNDAKAMRTWLLQVGYDVDEIDLVLDAGRAEMLAGLDRLASAAERSSLEQAVFYYSGHGTVIPDDDGDEGPDDASDEALVPVDFASSRGADYLVRDDEIYDRLRRVVAGTRQTVVIFDACHAGGGIRSVGDGPTRSLPTKQLATDDILRLRREAGLPTGPADASGIKAFSGSRPGEDQELPKAQDSQSFLFVSSSNRFQTSAAGYPPREPLSKFTEAFLQVVGPDWAQSANREGVVTIADLQSLLERRLRVYAQTPVLIRQGLDDGSAVLPGLFRPRRDSATSARLAAIARSLLTAPRNDRVASGLRARTTATPPLAVGTRFALEVSTERPGYLVVLTVGADGEATFLFPNQYRQKNAIRADARALVPYQDGLLIQPPVGTERYFVYLLQKNPFSGFPFGELAGPLAAGPIDPGLVSLIPDATERGMKVESLPEGVVAGSKRVEVGDWDAVELSVRTVLQ